MKFMLLASGVVAAALGNPVGAAAQTIAGKEMVGPAIADYGQVMPYTGYALAPDPKTMHKIVFDVTNGDEKSGVNIGLFHVARAVNAYQFAGVDKAHRMFAVVIHGAATQSVLTDAAFQAKNGKPNPNAHIIIDELTAAGVKIYVCGQALAGNKFGVADVNPKVEVALAALVAVPELEAQGYSLLTL